MPNVIPIIALGVATVSLVIAFVACVLTYRSYNTSPRKVVADLCRSMSDMDDDLHRLEGKYKKLNANYASLRSNGKNQHTENQDGDKDQQEDLPFAPRPGEDPQKWKRRARLALHRGELKHS